MKNWKWSFQSKDLVFSFPGFTLRTNESGSHHRNNCVRSTAPITILCQWQSLAFLSAAVQSGSNKCWGQKPENLPRGYIEAIRDTLLPCPESKSSRHNVNLVVYLTIHISNIPHFWVQSSSCTSIPDLWWFTCPGWHILRFGCSQAVSALSKMWRVSMASEHTVFVYTCTFLENGAMVRSGTPALSPDLYMLRPLQREGGRTIWDPL